MNEDKDAFWFRDAEDIVDEFLRGEIDRSSLGYERNFKDENGELFLSNILSVLRAKRSLAILDAGCGTGRALYEIKDQLLFRTRNRQNPQAVMAVGVNDRDYSDQSEVQNVRKSNKDGFIKYLVGDVEKVGLKPGTFDVVTSYEMLMHNPTVKVAHILQELQLMLKPGGQLFANLMEDQLNSPEVQQVLQRLQAEGAKVVSRLVKQKNPFDAQDIQTRAFLYVRAKE